MAESDMCLKTCVFKMDKNVIHLKTHNGRDTYYLCAWRIPDFSSPKFLKTVGFKVGNYPAYDITVNVNPGQAEVTISSKDSFSKWDISFFAHAGWVPLSAHVSSCHHVRCTYCPSYYRASLDGSEFQKLEKHPNNTCIVICRLKLNFLDFICMENTAVNISEKNSKYPGSSEVDLKNDSGVSSDEKVSLLVGEETEMVNKALLCARSPVFAKMLENDMKELKENAVVIADITMPILKTLISFLYSGILPDCDYDFLWDLYYAADKYDMKELQEACIELLLPKVSLENICQVLKLSELHNDAILKSAVMTLVSANIETLDLTLDWKIRKRDDPKLALEASTYFDF